MGKGKSTPGSGGRGASAKRKSAADVLDVVGCLSESALLLASSSSPGAMGETGSGGQVVAAQGVLSIAVSEEGGQGGTPSTKSATSSSSASPSVPVVSYALTPKSRKKTEELSSSSNEAAGGGIWPICIEIDVEEEVFEVYVNKGDDFNKIAADFCAEHELPGGAVEPIASFLADEAGRVEE